MNQLPINKSMELAPFGYALHKIVLDDNGHPIDSIVIEANEAFERNVGIKRADFINKKVSDVLPEVGDNYEGWIAICGEIALNGGSKTFNQYVESFQKYNLINIFSNQKNYFVVTFADNTQQVKKQVQADHLNTVHNALRQVNKLVVNEKENKHLIQKSCNILTTVGGYSSAWIVLVDEHQKILKSAYANLDIEFAGLKKQLENGILNECYSCVLEKTGVSTHADIKYKCDNCPIKNVREEYNILTTRLEYNNSIYGLLSLSYVNKFDIGEDEKGLIEEIANDISFALCTIEVEARKKQAEQTLQKNNKLLLEAQKIGKVGSWELDVETNKMVWSDEVYRMFNEKPQSFSSNFDDFFSFIHHDDQELLRKTFATAMKDKTVCNLVHRLLLKNEQEKYVRNKATFIYNNEGEPSKAVGTIQDITELKNFENALFESEKKYREIFENSTEGIYQTTPEGKVISANPALAEIMGYNSTEELINRLRDVVKLGYVDKSKRNEFLNILNKNGKVTNFEYEVYTKTGEIKWLKDNAHIRKNEDKSSYIIEGSLEDITAYKKNEKSILAYNKELELHRGLNNIIISGADKETVLDKILNTFQELCASKEILLFKYNQNTNALHIEKVRSDTEFSKGIKRLFKIDTFSYTPDISKENAYSKCIKEGKSFGVEDLDNMVSLFTNWTFPASDKHLLNKIIQFGKFVQAGGVPLVSQSGIWGLLTFETTEPLSNTFLQKLDHFATQATLALIKTENDEKLKLSESKYRSLVNNLPDVLWTISETGDITFMSPNVVGLFGYDIAEYAEGGIKFLLKNVHRKDVLHFVRSYRRVMKNGSAVSFEFRFRNKDGEWVWINMKTTGTYKKDGIIFSDGMATLINERKKAEDEILKFYQCVESSITPIGLSDLQGKIIYENPAALKMWGYNNLDEIVGMPVNSFWENNEGDEIVKSLREGKSYKGELLGRKKDGSAIEVQISTNMVCDNEGLPMFFVGSFMDVTEQNLIKKRLLIEKQRAEENEAKYLGLTKNIPGMIYKFDKDWGIEFISNSKMICGYDAELFYSKKIKWFDLVLHHEKERFWIEVEVLKRKPVSIVQEYPIMAKDGSIHFVADHKKSLFNENNEFAGVEGIVIDITDKKRVERELNEKNEKLKILIKKAEESDRLKSAFLANMSHEIRTPMNGILGFTNLLREPELSGEEQIKFIEIIQKSGERLLNTVNDLIDISRIEAGEMKLTIKEMDLDNEVESIYSFFKVEAENKGLQLHLKQPFDEKGIVVKTDVTKFNSVLMNLVKNALKYTNEGYVEIGYEVQSEYIKFYVKDTGLGIPKDRYESIFNRFEQVSHGESRVFEGSGLGLAISKAFLEMLGGKIWLESALEKGTTFYFTIPYERQEHESPTSVVQGSTSNVKEKSQKLKVLVAEDDQISQQHLSILLKNITREMIFVQSGIDAVEQCRKNPDINLILMDIKMPEMDGYKATSNIRKFNKDVIIIAQTAFALVGDREKALEAGCNDYITKPYNKEKLKRIIEQNFVKKD